MKRISLVLIAALFGTTSASQAMADLVEVTLSVSGEISVDVERRGESIVDFSDSDNPISFITGEIKLAIDIDLATGEIASVQPLRDGTDLSYTDTSLEAGPIFGSSPDDDFRLLNLTGTLQNLQGNTPASVDNSGGFDQSGFAAIFDGGTALAFSSLGDLDLDLASSNQGALFLGTGRVIVEPVGPGLWGISLEMPVDRLSIPLLAGSDSFIVFSGSIIGTGQLATIIPEPTSGLFLTSLCAFNGIIVRRRRN